MSDNQLKAFLEQVKADATLQEKLRAAITTEQAVAIAQDAGFSLDAVELQSAIDEAELEGAAGGGQRDCQVRSSWGRF